MKGAFHFTIRTQFSPAAALRPRPNTDPSLGSLATDLDEQLGLKLESRRGPLDVLVIDSVEAPTEN